ncbi:MAG: FAD-binding protein, partial [Lachnospiraceae bacterium]|nr:FAD-binding protein [Lachnospiraceae bacterium]
TARAFPNDTLLADLSGKAADCNVDIRTRSEVYEILTEDGKVSGVRVIGPKGRFLTYHANQVIIATGGFGRNLEMLLSFRPDLKKIATTNTPYTTGDAVVFLEALGADFSDMEKINLYPFVLPSEGTPLKQELIQRGGILVDGKGQRFVDENGDTEKVSDAILSKEANVYLVLNQAIYDSEPFLKVLDQRGQVLHGQTAAMLAQSIGLSETDFSHFQETLQQWDNSLSQKSDKAFNRDLTDANSDFKGSYCALMVTPGITECLGGVKTDAEGRVLRVSGKPIEGLFAVGEVAAGPVDKGK